MKFNFAADIVLEAKSIEEALIQFASHVSTVARRVGSEHELEDCNPQFKLSEVHEDTESHDLTGVHNHDPIPLDLDPKSPQGITHEEQKAELAERAEQDALDKVKDTRTDAENLAEHSAREQAAHAEKEI